MIFIGGVVRSTGSGMGCPDWPKCFGSFIPPTSVEQLPANYKEYYSAYRDKKNQRFASFLQTIGREETAKAILSDPQVKKEGDFDPVKTMIEYVNRLVGALIGLMMTALFIFSFRQPIVYRVLTGLAWFAVLVTGWFGSIVVSTNLTSWTVTIHLGLAFITIGLLSAAWAYADFQIARPSNVPVWLIWLSAGLLVAQLFLGTRVRSEIDVLAVSGVDRAGWIDGLSFTYVIHRTSSWLVLACFASISWYLFKRTGDRFSASGLVGVILGLMLSGAVLSYLEMPWMIQPAHLLLATLAFGVLIVNGIKSSLSSRYSNAN